ncbi:MAG: hypothetical protein HZB57_05030 [Gammaproteobacteria bacterium]|nr:hypothetical protein [Gammaproteobacteria bacterium]
MNAQQQKMSPVALAVISILSAPLASATDMLSMSIESETMKAATCDDYNVRVIAYLPAGEVATVDSSITLSPTDGSAPIVVNDSFAITTTDPTGLFREYFTRLWNQTLNGTYVVSGQATLRGYNTVPIDVSQIGLLECTVTCTGTLGDYVWLDSDRDGIQDSTEAGLNGVIVSLQDSNGTIVTTTTMTGGPDNKPGYYQFPNLCLGQYTVSADANPLGMNLVPTIIGNAPGIADDSNEPAGTLVTLATNDASDQTIDFGYVTPKLDVGTGTPGYWKNHSEAWPVESITIGGVTYPKATAISLMSLAEGNAKKADKTITMFKALVAAKLNVALGTEASCINQTIENADDWMATYGPVRSQVLASSQAWVMGSPLHAQLDDYNNGRLCAPHRDSLAQ